MKGKQNAVHPYDGKIFGLQKGGNSDTCTNPEDITLREMSPTPKDQDRDSLYMRPLAWPDAWRQKVKGGAGGQDTGMGRPCLRGTKLLLGMMKKVWRWMVVTAARQCDCT